MFRGISTSRKIRWKESTILKSCEIKEWGFFGNYIKRNSKEKRAAI